MVTRTIPNFSLSQICRSGQCFRMEEKEDHTMVIIAGDRYLEARQQGEECCFYCEETEFEDFWKEYFDLENDYAVYTERINPNDAYLRQAVGYGSGIRILRQELWEMIVSFLISQQNNIVRIRRCIKNICEHYGDIHVNGRGEVYYGFPKPEVLAELQDDDLKACNLGYRSKYVVRAARSVVSGEIDLETVSRLPYCKAREALLSLYGVGEKVADCICLFALHHLQAFPVDTHIQQAMQAHYRRGFPKRRYQGFQGVIQQYIFYYELYGKMEA
ncbi:MAG: DNA-3-methyladenine glycosylase 2 family protein [Lachnospiraceae bacterium]|nr:DNA-3-methyladenine glycosylase 2 family protein [Lachnospiraceae bacterium]